jgi:cytidylate kinase
MIVAIDGPAAAGKGTLARLLAAHFGFAHLETGLLYRAVGARVLAAGGDPADPDAATRTAAALVPADLARSDLRDEPVGEAASQVAAIPAVRAALLAFQRDFAEHPPGGAAGAVLDGRDIGTVVCPAAAVKLFVTASLAVRADRRYRELAERGERPDRAAVVEDLRRRDARDSARGIAPLAAAPDAHLLDTSNLSIETAFAHAKSIISAHLR